MGTWGCADFLLYPNGMTTPSFLESALVSIHNYDEARCGPPNNVQ